MIRKQRLFLGKLQYFHEYNVSSHFCPLHLLLLRRPEGFASYSR